MCAHLPQMSVAHDGQYNMMGSQLCCYNYKYIALLMSDFKYKLIMLIRVIAR